MSFKSNLIILLTAIVAVSCSYKDKERAKKLTAEASKLAYDFNLDAVKRQDSALALYDKAIVYDADYLGAYMGKSYILAERRDLPALLDVNAQIIRLRPDQPLWKIQRGSYLELSGKKEEAAEFYKTGLQQYEDIFEDDPETKKDINLRIAYINALQFALNDDAGKKEFEKLKAEFPNDEIVKSYPFIPKSEAVELWLHPEKAEEIEDKYTAPIATQPGL